MKDMSIKQKQRALKQAYKETPPQMGILKIQNKQNGKVFLITSRNIPGSINSAQFQLKNGVHRNPALQKDWQEYGADNFSFEVLEQLKPDEVLPEDIKEELLLLEEKWLEEFQPYEEKGYHKRK